MGIIRQLILYLGLIIICPKYVFAGAWIPNEGKTEIIISANTVGNDPNHTRAMEYYVARGLGSNSALIFSQNFKFYQSLPVISKTDLKMQFKLYQGQGIVISSQVGISTVENVQISQRDNNSLANLLFGYGFGNNWVNLEYGYEECFGEYHHTSEVTLGRHVRKRDLLIIKHFYAGCDYYNENNNLQISYIKYLNHNLGFELGLRQSSSIARFDQNKTISNGFILSLWKKY